MGVGHRLKELRKELKISQKELGNLLNVAQQVVSYYEKSGNIDASKLSIISEKYSIDIRYFFEDKPLNSYRGTNLQLNSSSDFIIPAGWDDILHEMAEIEYGKVRVIESVVRTLIKEFKN
jgi:transcriptional regulator with XRE-family HTH domain